MYVCNIPGCGGICFACLLSDFPPIKFSLLFTSSSSDRVVGSCLIRSPDFSVVEGWVPVVNDATSSEPTDRSSTVSHQILSPAKDKIKFTHCMVGNSASFLSSADFFFFKINFFNKIFQEYHHTIKQFGSRLGPRFGRV